MAKSDINKLKKIYREYARIKFKKYKLQYPRLRETEIVNKILDEWQGLSQEAKNNLGEQFISRTGSQFLNISSSSSKQKNQAMNKKQSSDNKIKKSERTKKSSPKVRVFSEKNKKASPSKLVQNLVKDSESDFKGSQKAVQGGKSTPSDQVSSSDNKTKKISKIKKIAKNRQIKERKILGQRAAFYKYYQSRLSSQHPRWSPVQISTIVKLLWKKKKQKPSNRVSNAKLSGRQIYRRKKESEGFIKDQIKSMWRSLPHQSKIFWQILGGKRRVHRSERTTSKHVKKILNSGASRKQQNNVFNYDWMNHQIKAI